MTTVVVGEHPPEIDALLERRRRAGLDRLDEVWEGVLHMIPAPGFEHARIAQQLAVVLDDPAERAIHWLLLAEGEYEPAERSGLIDLGRAELVERIDWP